MPRQFGEADLSPSAPRTAAEWVRAVGNAANLSTPLGLLIAAVGRARVRLGPRGLFLGEGYRLPFPMASAFTVGDVVLTSSTFPMLLSEHPLLLEHEERHSWQYLWCLGLPFLPAYSICVAWSMLRTGDLAAANVFEVHAGLETGGYRHHPRRPLGVGVRALTARVRVLLRPATPG